MNRLPDFSSISRSQQEPVSERVSLHASSLEGSHVASGALSCDSQLANDGEVLLDSPTDENALRQVDFLQSSETEYIVALISLSDDKCKARFEIKASQELE